MRLGVNRSKSAFVAVYGVAACFIIGAATQSLGALLGLVGLLAAFPVISTVRSASDPGELVRALGMTARVQIVVGVLYAVGLSIR